MGTFGGALEARQIDASNGKLTAEVTGEVETEEGVLVIRRVHVGMRLVAPEEAKATVERTHDICVDALPALPYIAQNHPTGLFFRTDCSLNYLGCIC